MTNITPFRGEYEQALLMKLNSSKVENDVVAALSGCLYTKILVPRVTIQNFERKQLKLKLNNFLNKKLAFICAPAGYGKTTLVADWINSKKDEISTAWITLGEEDNSEAAFLKYIIISLEKAFPGEFEAIMPMTYLFEKYSKQIFINVIINKINSLSKQLVIVLDDYHLINDKGVHSVVQDFIRHLSSNIHILIASRSKLPFGVTKLKVQEEVVEINADEMKFTENETHEYFEKCHSIVLSSKELSLIDDNAEGWVTGLKVLGMSLMNDKDVLTNEKVFKECKCEILSYLTEEIIDKMPEDILEFLCKTSLLHTINSSICNYVTNRSDSGELLEMLETNNYFTFSLDQSKECYRYHQLLVSLLNQRCYKLYNNEIESIFIKASEWFENNGNYSDSILYSIKSGDKANTARLVEQYSARILNNGEYNRLVNLIEALPIDIMEYNANICLYYAFSCAITGRLSKDESVLLERGINLEDDRFIGKDTTIAVIRSTAALYTDNINIKKVIELSEYALEKAESVDVKMIMAYNNLANAYALQGKMKLAKKNFELSYETAIKLNCNNTANKLVHKLAQIAINEGELNKSLELYRKHLSNADNSKDHSSFTNMLMLGLGSLYYEFNDIDKARKLIKNSTILSNFYGDKVRLMQCYLSLAKIETIQDNREDALKLIEIVEEMKKEPMLGFTFKQNLSAIIRLLLTLNKIAKADDIISSYRKDTQSSVFIDQDCFIAITDYQICTSKGKCNLKALNEYIELAENDFRINNLIKLSLLKVLYLKKKDRRKEALDCLKKVIRLASEHGYIRTVIDYSQHIGDLLYELKNNTDVIYGHGIDRTYIKDLLSVLNKGPSCKSDSDKKISTANVYADLTRCLSYREIEVLKCIAEGLTNSEISEELYISLSTVKKHLSSIFDKLKVRSRTKALLVARELDII